MPERSWGNSVGSGSDSRLTLAYDRIDYDADNGWLVNPRVVFSSKSRWSDSTNSISVSGTAIHPEGQIHSGMLNGGTRVWGVGAEVVPLQYGTTVWRSFIVTVYGISFFNGDQATTSYQFDIDFPNRPYKAPRPATSVTASRESDARINVSWQISYDGGNGAQPLHQQYIDRTETGNWNDYVNISGELGWQATSWPDTSVRANARYDYRHIGRNTAGYSAHCYAASPVYTTPAAATAPQWEKTAAGDVRLTWTIRAKWGSKQWVEDSTDGGATWTKVSPDLPGSASGWTHPSPSTATPHRYRVVTEVPNGLRATSETSSPVALLAPPLKPTPLAPDGVAALGEPIVLQSRHNPADGTPQTAREVRHRASPTSAWVSTGKVVTAADSISLPAGTYTSGRPEWQSRTWGQHADPSDWSDVWSFALAHRPVGGLTVPNSTGVWDASVMPISGTYFDQQGYPLMAWRIRLSSPGLADRVWSDSALPIAATADALANGRTYTATLEVRNTAGLWSSPVARTAAVAYAPPVMPGVSLTYRRDDAAVDITITNPTTGIPVVRNEVRTRAGQLLGEVGPNGTFTWRLPPIDGTAAVVVRAITASPSSIDTDPLPVQLPRGDLGVHLNAGPGFAFHAALWAGSPKMNVSIDTEKHATRYAGDTLESVTYGDAEPYTLDLSGVVRFADPDSSRDAFTRVIRARTAVCYRDPVRTLYGHLEGPGFSEGAGMLRHATLKLQFVESGSDMVEQTEWTPTLIEDPPGTGDYRILLTSADVRVADLLT